MKKIITIVLCVALFACVLTACSSEKEDETNINAFFEFSTQTVSGKEITNEVFADYDLTMVNIWATWCPPCVGEIPYFQDLYESLGENVNLITICQDADTQLELAKQILDGATYETLVSNAEINKEIMKRYQSFPTTVFVDSEGNIVGNLEIGAPPKNVVGTYQGYINDRLEMLGK